MSESVFIPTGQGQTRPHSLYISWHLHKALGYVARASVDAECSTREGVAEKVLGDWLEAEHPEIMSWLKQREADEREFQKKLKPIPFT